MRKRRKRRASLTAQQRNLALGACIVGLVAVSVGLFVFVFPSESVWERETTTEANTDVTLEQEEPEILPGVVAVTNLTLPTTSAEDMVAAMDLDAKIAQLFMINCPDDDQGDFVYDYQPGGIMLVADSFVDQTVGSMYNLVSAMQMEAVIPLLVAVEEEGGDVVSISSISEFRAWPFQSPRSLYKEGGYSYIEVDTAEKDKLLKSMGINVNFAPVADVSLSSEEFMYDRSFGTSAEETAQYVFEVVDQMGEDGVGSVLKHFPGHGGNADPDENVIIDDRGMGEFSESDFLPFIEGIEAGADSIMMSNNIVTAMDGELSASLSSPVINYLRERLLFDGVIICDYLEDPTVQTSYDVATAATKAIQAGNDLILTDASYYADQYTAVYEAVNNGFIDMQSLDDSVVRVLNWKASLGLITFDQPAETEEETTEA